MQRLQIINHGELTILVAAPDTFSATLDSTIDGGIATPRARAHDSGARFVVLADTAFDQHTRLEWARPPLGGERATFADAERDVAACRIGGHSDWRLPTREELQSLVDYTRHDPAIDTDAFPNTPAAAFWSSSPDASGADYAWVVVFLYGGVSLLHRDVYAFVRAVRAVPSSQ